MSNTSLNSLEEIRQFIKTDNSVYYFISASNFNLMMMSDWVDNWLNVNFIDCYDQKNISVILPEYEEEPLFNDIEGINHFLLGNKKIVEHIKANVSGDNPGKVLFLFYDPELEALVKTLGMELIMPPNKLVKEIDNKITTTEIGNSVDVPSVPNALIKIDSYSQLRSVCKEYNLGDDVVIQSAFGDSGKTTWFIANQEDYHQVSEKIEAEDKVKVMRKVNCLQVAIEACATRNGTFVGPVLTEIIGHPALTPYPGGWCGNDVNPEAFSKTIQSIMFQYTQRLGEALYKRGYRGYFEVDYLIDADSDDDRVYLGEINPRVTGISALTNLSSFCNDNIPLFAFHLLEYGDQDFTIDPKQFNQQVMNSIHKPFGQLIFKATDADLKILTTIPDTGIYTINNGELNFIKAANSPKDMGPDEIFILRIMKNGDYIYKGADLVIVFANHLMQDKIKNLTPEAENLITTIQANIQHRELTEEEKQLAERYAGHTPSIKSTEE